MGSVFTKIRLGNTNLLICLCLIAATLVAYWPLKNQEFINFDDDKYVTENHHVREGLTSEGIVWAFTDCSQAGLWIPVTWLSLMLDSQIYGQNASGYKLTNLLFHLANILLLFMLLNRMTGKLWNSAFVAALFALHPLHVESVAWVTERKDVLSTLFWMLTMWSYLYYVEFPSTKRYLMIVLPLTFGLMAKPMLVTLPFVLLLIDYWPLNRLQISGSHSGDERSHHHWPVERMRPASFLKLVMEKVPLIVLAAIASIITFLGQRAVGAVEHLSILPVGVRITNSLISYVIYIWEMLWPRSLGILYPFPLHTLLLWQGAGAGLILVTISILVLRTHRRQPYLLAGWFWFLGTLLPVIGLVQVGVVARADRFTYIPSIGMFIIISWGIPSILSGWHHRKIALSLAAGVYLAAVAVACHIQVQLWQDTVTLFEHTLNITENNYVIHNNLGRVLLDEGDVDKATGHFLEALKINSGYPDAHNNLGLALFRNGQIDMAVKQFTEAIRLNPGFAIARTNLGEAFAQQGRVQEANAQYSEATRLNPNYAAAQSNMGIALAQEGKTSEAADHFSEAIRLEPDNPDAYINLGLTMRDLGRTEEAAQAFLKALQLKPDYAEAHVNLGILLAQQERFDEAINHFSRALQHRPDYAEAHSNIGIVLFLQGKTEEAEQHFSEAIRLNPDLEGKIRQNMQKAR